MIRSTSLGIVAWGLFIRRASSETSLKGGIENIITFSTPHHGSSNNLGGPGSRIPCRTRFGVGQDFQDCLDSAASLQIEAMRSFNFIDCDIETIYWPTLWQIDGEREPLNHGEALYAGEHERNCLPNPLTWRQDGINYVDLTGDKDQIIGFAVTAVHPWESYDWRFFGADYPRPNHLTTDGLATTANQLWDYYYTCSSGITAPQSCHPETARALPPFCFAVSQLTDIDKIAACTDIALGDHRTASDPQPVESRVVETSHPLILGDHDGWVSALEREGSLAAHTTMSLSIPISTAADALITLQSYPDVANYTLFNPQGHVVMADGLSTTTSVVTNSDWGNVYQYRIDAPQTGTWTLQFTSGISETDYALLSKANDQIGLDLRVDQNSVTPASLVTVSAVLSGTNRPLSITAAIQHPDGVTETLALLDNGANGDHTAGDHIYTGQFTAGSTSGYTAITAVATSDQLIRTATSRVAVIPQTAKLWAAYTQAPPDNNSDGLYDELSFNVIAQTFVDGHFSLHGRLVSDQGAVATASFSSRTSYSTTLPAGFYEFPLTFAAEEIYASGHSGPYTLTELILIDENRYGFVVDQQIDARVTPAYPVNRFEGERTIHLSGVDIETPDGDNNGFYDALEVNLAAHSDLTGTFRVSGQLVDEAGGTIAWGQSEWVISDTGRISPTLSFSGTLIRQHQANGAYTLQNLTLLNTDGDHWSQFQVTTTVPFSYTQFEGLTEMAVNGVKVNQTTAGLTLTWEDMGVVYEVWRMEALNPVPMGDCLSLPHCTIQPVNHYLLPASELPLGLHTAVVIGRQQGARSRPSEPVALFTFQLESGQ